MSALDRRTFNFCYILQDLEHTGEKAIHYPVGHNFAHQQ